MSKHDKIYYSIITVLAVIAVIGIGCIVYRDLVNQGRCKVKYGEQAQWLGQNKCAISKPTEGLL